MRGFHSDQKSWKLVTCLKGEILNVIVDYRKDSKNYLADCYYRSNNIEKAIEIYRKTLEDPTNGFTEIAAIRISKYLFNNKKYEEAIPYYERFSKHLFHK